MSKSGTCKIVAVGDGAVGKTCLLMVYTQRKFPEEYVPTVFDNYDTTVKKDEKIIKLSVWDTAGQEEFDKLRYLSYPNTNIFIVCYSVMSKASYDNVTDKWLPELAPHSKDAIIVLVGTKIDLRDDEGAVAEVKKNGDDIVSEEEGEKLATDIKAVKYFETSARQQIGVDEVFGFCVDLFNNKDKGGSKKKSGNSSGKKACLIL